MAEQDWLTEQFEQSRPHLQAVAYSMLGTVSEAQDAVQEAWLRLHRSDAAPIGDLRGWLTTVVGRISLDLLRARKARREVYPGSWLPEPLVDDSAADGPEHHAVLADSVGLALLVVLETLSPPERLSFVLHDVFAVPFDDIAQIMDKTPESARQLASRARRRVQAAPQPDRDLARQRQVVDAFLAAARDGDFEALLEVLDPGVVFRMDLGPGSPLARAPLAGATLVARYVLATAPRFVNLAQPVLVNGEAGVLFGTRDDPIAVIGFTIADGRIAALNLVADQAKLRNLTIQPKPPAPDWFPKFQTASVALSAFRLAKPAQRALAAAGYTTVEPLTQVTEADLAPLHGVGATAIEQLRQALAAAGLSFAPEN